MKLSALLEEIITYMCEYLHAKFQQKSTVSIEKQVYYKISGFATTIATQLDLI